MLYCNQKWKQTTLELTYSKIIIPTNAFITTCLQFDLKKLRQVEIIIIFELIHSTVKFLEIDAVN